MVSQMRSGFLLSLHSWLIAKNASKFTGMRADRMCVSSSLQGTALAVHHHAEGVVKSGDLQVSTLYYVFQDKLLSQWKIATGAYMWVLVVKFSCKLCDLLE